MFLNFCKLSPLESLDIKLHMNIKALMKSKDCDCLLTLFCFCLQQKILNEITEPKITRGN